MSTLTITLLDFIGTFAFAAYGSYAAIEKEFDLFGVAASACIYALAGGTVREIILGHMPLYFHDARYFFAVAAAVLFAILTAHMGKVRRYLLLVDALGLSTFAFIGAARAVGAGLGLIGITSLAVLTAAGGGIIGDIVLNEKPRVFHSDFYAVPAMILGILYWIFASHRDSPIFIALVIIGVFLLRLVAIIFAIELPRPSQRKKKNVRSSLQ